jgi:hypothetical protein
MISANPAGIYGVFAVLYTAVPAQQPTSQLRSLGTCREATGGNPVYSKLGIT